MSASLFAEKYQIYTHYLIEIESYLISANVHKIWYLLYVCSTLLKTLAWKQLQTFNET